MFNIRNKKELAMILDKEVPEIPEPIEALEQYTVPGDLAALMAWDVAGRYSIEDSRILDLGAGTCRLAIALGLLGAQTILAIEYDKRLIELCQENIRRLNLSYIVQPIQAWITRNAGIVQGIDIVVSNPPFGVIRKGADRNFIEFALSKNVKAAYFIVKSGNYDFHRSLGAKYGYTTRLLVNYRFPIKASMKKHRSRIRRVDVDVVIFEKK